MHCCGVNNFEDFHDNEHLKSSGKMVPDACCMKENGDLKDRSCPVSPTYSNSYHQQVILNIYFQLSNLIFYLVQPDYKYLHVDLIKNDKKIHP